MLIVVHGYVKWAFCKLLGSQMEQVDSVRIQYSSGVADYDVVRSACTIAQDKPVIVVGDETDILILLLRNFRPDQHHNMYLQTSSKLIDICHLQENLHRDMCQSLLFMSQGVTPQ